MPAKNDREYRNMIMEIRSAEDPDQSTPEMVVRGYASTFNEPYTLFEDDNWRLNEVVDANAFAETIEDRKSVV